jgi:hypothetical protein
LHHEPVKKHDRRAWLGWRDRNRFGEGVQGTGRQGSLRNLIVSFAYLSPLIKEISVATTHGQAVPYRYRRRFAT